MVEVQLRIKKSQINRRKESVEDQDEVELNFYYKSLIVNLYSVITKETGKKIENS